MVEKKFHIIYCQKPKEVKCDHNIGDKCCWPLRDKKKCGYMLVV